MLCRDNTTRNDDTWGIGFVLFEHNWNQSTFGVDIALNDEH